MPHLIWSPEALEDAQHLYDFLLQRTLTQPDVRQARSVTGCRSLRIIQMSVAPRMTWTQSFRNGRSALVLADMSRSTACNRTRLWSSRCTTRKKLSIRLSKQIFDVILTFRTVCGKISDPSGPNVMFRFFQISRQNIDRLPPTSPHDCRCVIASTEQILSGAYP